MATLLEILTIDSDATALIIPSESPLIILSHKELLEQTLKFQKKLAAIGVSPKDAVALAFTNTIEFAIAFLATTFQRANKQDEFEFYLEDLSATVILLPKGSVDADGEAVRAARKCSSSLEEIYWDGSKVAMEIKEQGQMNKMSRVRVETPLEEDVALILHTSGTTGRPTAVPLSHKNLCQTMENIKATYLLTPTDRTLLAMPLFHVHGLLAGFLAPFGSGGSLIMPPKFSASEFWNDFVTYKANWYTAVPSMHQILLRGWFPQPMPATYPIPKLEEIYRAPVLEAYAMTEAAHQMTSNPLPAFGPHKPGSVGIAQGLELKIIDDDGNSLEQGKIGKVCVLGPNVTTGYLGDPKVVASPFTKDGYLRTGDQGYLDEEGFLFLTGRIKGLINKGGEKISPIEIDNLLAKHPKILEAVSFAIDDELYGQNVAATITLREDDELPEDELLECFGLRAAKFKIPKKVYFTANMPNTATGKVQRRLVAKEMLEGDKNIDGRKESLVSSAATDLKEKQGTSKGYSLIPAWLNSLLGGLFRRRT